MEVIGRHIFRFVLCILLQVLVFNQLEVGLGIYPMIYPLFILLLPFELGTITLLIIAFVTGIIIDAFSNTYGLHTSALLLVAYFRPIIFASFSPRDGYENMKEPNLFEMGRRWFLYASGSLLLIHHAWFFIFEIFKWNDFFFTAQKILFSAPISYLFCVLIQFLIIKRTKK